MQTKLTLRMEDTLIRAAKQRARDQGVSLSRLVAEFFAQLAAADDEGAVTPWTESLVGAARPPAAVDALTDAEARDRVLDVLADKHA